MPINQEVKCDICDERTLQPKGWFMAKHNKYSRVVFVKALDLRKADGFKYFVLCGENCVHKLMAQRLPLLHNTAPKAGPCAKPVPPAEQQAVSEYSDLAKPLEYPPDTAIGLEKCMRCECYSTHIIAGLCVDCAVDLQYTGIDTTSEDPNAER